MEQNEKHALVARLKSIFETIIDAEFTSTNYVYFEKLIAYLSKEDNAFLLQSPFMMDWVEKVIEIITEDILKINPRVVSFMLNICGLLISNEWLLIEIKERKLLERVLSIVQSQKKNITPSMKLSVIRVLTSVSDYSIGLNYIRVSKSWFFLIEYCNQDHTIYVVREARKLLFNLLYKYAVFANDEKTVLEILSEIIKPILDNVYDETTADKITIVVEDTDLQHKLGSTLDLLSYIFQQTLECANKTRFSIICHDHFNFELNIWKLTEMTTNQPFMQKILTTLVSFNYCRLIDEMWTDAGQIAPEKFNRFGIAFFNTMKFCVVRNDFINFLNLTAKYHILWKKLGTRAPKDILVDNESVKFENQLTIMHLMPLICLLKSKEIKEVEVFDTYLMKLFQISCEHTLRICYCIRNLLLSSEVEYLVPSLAYKAIHGVLSMENVLEQDQAVLVFQAITYALQEFLLNSYRNHDGDKDNAQNQMSLDVNIERIPEIPNLLYAALVGLQSLIKRYRITWTESLETICVVNFVLHLLQNPNMTSRLIVQALKLLQLSIEHYLSPNMALLVDTLKGSGLMSIAPTIIKRFHDPNWEVRDSTLELTTSISSISRLKFPPFQQHLVENKMAPIVYEMAKNDSEPYVRASAFRCLSQMVAINILWETELSKFDLVNHIFWVLINETEGIVRKEALITLSKIYAHRKIPSQHTETLYSTMAHCVVNDLHWEVKIAALQFWEMEIQQHFTNQGMIDGTFPTVTFSKEHKKIVILNEKEINLRIIKILNSLSQRGCLGVILKCLNDDCDFQVVKESIEIVRRLYEKLQKYDYESVITDNFDPSCNLSPLQSQTFVAGNKFDESCNSVLPPDIKMELEGFEDEVDDATAGAAIEQILDEHDINYLIAACKNKINLNGVLKNEMENVNNHFYKQFAAITAKDFIEAIKSINMEQLLQNQQCILRVESLFSLVEDILIEIQPNYDKIYADCY